MEQPTNISQYIDYLDDDRAKTWLLKEYSDRRGVWVSNAFMHMCGGNAYDAMLLGQIVHWSGVNENMKPKLTHWRANHLWIVKTSEDWAKELGFNSWTTVRKCIDRLCEKDIVIKELHKSPFKEHGDSVVNFIRLNWTVFGDYLDQWAYISESSEGAVDLIGQPGVDTIGRSGLTQQVNPIYTENTTENTTEKSSRQTAFAGTPIETGFDSDEEVEAEDVSFLAKRISGNYRPKSKLPPSQLNLLAKSVVVVNGASVQNFTNPESLYEASELFRQFVDYMIAKLNNYSKPKPASKSTIISAIRNYEGGDGWFAFEKRHGHSEGQAVEYELPEDF